VIDMYGLVILKVTDEDIYIVGNKETLEISIVSKNELYAEIL